MRAGAGGRKYRFFKASLQILDLDFLLKRDMADRVPLLAELTPEVLTVENNGLSYYPGSESNLSHVCPSSIWIWLSSRRRSFSPERSRSLCIFWTLAMRSER